MKIPSLKEVFVIRETSVNDHDIVSLLGRFDVQVFPLILGPGVFPTKKEIDIFRAIVPVLTKSGWKEFKAPSGDNLLVIQGENHVYYNHRHWMPLKNPEIKDEEWNDDTGDEETIWVNRLLSPVSQKAKALIEAGMKEKYQSSIKEQLEKAAQDAGIQVIGPNETLDDAELSFSSTSQEVRKNLKNHGDDLN